MSKNSNWFTPGRLALGLLGLVVAAVLIYQIPSVQARLSWRVTVAEAYLRGLLNPAGELPTPLPHLTDTPGPTNAPTATLAPSLTPTPLPVSPTPLPPTLTPTPIPASVALPAPQWEKQGANNCGPASLSIYLHYYGWEGSQEDIADLVKPVSEDRNVNPEELVYFVRTRAGWLNTEFRVGGDIELMKKLLAAGFPVLVEKTFMLEASYWPNDDRWAGHYWLLTGYDDAEQSFIGQDSYLGPDQRISYTQLDEEWKIFNRVYLLVYLPHQEETLKAILGLEWDAAINRQHALETAQRETEADPNDAYAWFNLGSNLVYFERYSEASTAYDTARTLGLPQRMLRYQFGPFFAYFHSGQIDELMTLTAYALQITDNSEEAHLWRGWALYRTDQVTGAIVEWRKALAVNPNYQDALYALSFVGASP